MFVKYRLIPHIRDCTTSIETWKTLKELYESKNTNQVLSLKSKRISIRMEENENVGDFISRIKDVKDKLGNIGETISSIDLVNITLNGMLEEH